MAYKKSIIVRTQFDGIHNWKGCDIEAVMFLKHPHRHKFFVEVKMPVTHDDRDLEFFMVKRSLDLIIDNLFSSRNNAGCRLLGSMSCEMIAQDIITMLAEEYSVNKITCSVFEDNENGAEVVWTVD